MDLWIFTLLILGSACGAGVIYVFLRKTAAQIAAMKAHAKVNGWTFNHTPASFNENAATSFTDPQDTWCLTYAIGQNATQPYSLTWQSPAHPLTEGACILGPIINPKATQFVDGALPNIGTRLFKGLLLRSKENLNDLAPNLKAISADQTEGLLLATQGQEDGLDDLRSDPDLMLERQKHADLIIIRDINGLTLRQSRQLTKMEQLSTLTAFGKAVDAALNR